MAGTAARSQAAQRPKVPIAVYDCNTCHGSDGQSAGPAIPTIAGLSREYFIKSMREYRDGTRPATVMDRIAKGYTPAQIAAMADYFSRQRFLGHPQLFDQELVTLGKRMHAIYCFKCHVDNGRSRVDRSGILAGQWAPYLRRALLNSAEGGRPMPRVMGVRLSHLYQTFGPRAIDALAAFYASQHNPQ